MQIDKRVINSLVRVSAAICICFGAFTAPAHAVDGCKVLLCLAGNWSNISQCRPDVEQAMRDTAQGRGWPTCDMGDSNVASMQWADQATCPIFYSMLNGESGDWAGCSYEGVIHVTVADEPWSDVFWSTAGGGTSTRYFAPARSALGSSIDPRYDNDLAAYLATRPIIPDCTGDGC